MRWLHRAGYVCTAIVALQLVAISFYVGRDWLRYMRIEEEQRKDTATRPGPIGAYGPLADRTPGLSSLDPDSARIFAEPALEDVAYGLSVSARDRQSNAAAVLVRWRRAPSHEFDRTEFVIPAEAYGAAMAELDARADGFQGDGSLCLDGTGISFERRRGNSVVSGAGNACSDHYQAISDIFLRLAQRFGPVFVDDLDRGWYRKDRGRHPK
jgi:hypothetical protein